MSTTDQLVEALLALHSAGGRMRVVDGRLQVDVDIELAESVWQTIKAHRGELVASLAGDRPLWGDAPIWPDRPADRPAGPSPDGIDRCGRCGSTETVDSTIHDGASVRRDCAACGRFWKFTLWYGVVMP